MRSGDAGAHVRICVASTFVPFVYGGGRMIVDDLARELVARGHEAEPVLLPFWPDPAEMLEQMHAIRLTDLGDACERLICIRTPSYLLPHPNKVVWFIHHHRGAYDLWGTPWQDIPDSPDGHELREAIVRSDDLALGEARRVFANSRRVADRLRIFNAIEADVLYPPLHSMQPSRCDGYGDFLFYPSRVNPIKRQLLAIEAMRLVETPVRLVLAGLPESGWEGAVREALLGHPARERITWFDRFISEDEKADLLAEALAVAYLPFDEDSYGYVSLEAYAARKPVVTCSDSGGVLELVEHDVTGLVAEPSAQGVARSFDRLWRDRALAARLGDRGWTRVREELDVSWDHVIDELLAP